MSSYLDYKSEQTPTGWRKILYLNWPLVFLLTAVASAGFLMLYSVAGGRAEVWAQPQMERFAVGMIAMVGLAFVPIWFWRAISVPAYVICVLLLVAAFILIIPTHILYNLAAIGLMAVVYFWQKASSRSEPPTSLPNAA